MRAVPLVHVQLSNIRRAAERGRAMALEDYDRAVIGKERFSYYVDMFQHLIDDIERIQ
jgi:hypothetical protein